MPNCIEKAISRARAISNAAVRGVSSGRIGMEIFSGDEYALGAFGYSSEQSRAKRKYELFKGWIFSAIDAIACEAASQPVQLGRMTGTKAPGKKKESSCVTRARQTCIKGKMPACLSRVKAAGQEVEVILDHDVLNVLEYPNPFQPRWQFVYSFVANLCLTGWAYVIAGDNKDGRPEFYSIPTSWVTPDFKKGIFWVRNPDNPSEKAISYDRTQIGYAYLPDPSDPLRAKSPTSAQDAAINIDDKIQSSQNVFFENAVMPSVIITVGQNPTGSNQAGLRPRLTGAQRSQIYGAIKKVYTGVANYGNPAIVDGLIEKMERWGASQNEIGWEKSEDKVKARILSAFSVHPFILGESVPGSYAQAYNIEDRFKSRVNIYLNMLSAMMTLFCPIWFASLIGETGKKKSPEKLLIWWEKCEPSDPSMLKSEWENARLRGDVTQNEWRTARLGLPPDEDRNESILADKTIPAVTAVATNVKKGALEVAQGVAILVAMGLPDEDAKNIIGKGPTQEDLDRLSPLPNSGQGAGRPPKPQTQDEVADRADENEENAQNPKQDRPKDQ